MIRPMREIMLLTLARDGRLTDEQPLRRLLAAAPPATDCFVFCHGWLHDAAEARREAMRFFALLDAALVPLRSRVNPLFVALHWPSRPLPSEPGESIADGVADALRQVPPAFACALLGHLCESEVPDGPEEAAELEGLRRQLRVEAAGATVNISLGDALSFWHMKRRAGQVGARFGREHLPAIARTVRTHLIGHSFGSRLAAAAALADGGVESLTLLLAAFSSFAFAPDVPGFARPGAYHGIIANRRVRRPIAVVRSEHDEALASLYPLVGGGPDLACASALGASGRTKEIIATSALGAVGARGVGAPDVTLEEVQRIGLPQHPIVNVDGSGIIRAKAPLIGAHRDILHREIATLVLLVGGLLIGGPEGLRPPPLDSLSVA